MALKAKDETKVWAEAVIRHPPELTEAVANFFFEKGARAVVNEESSGLVTSRAGFGAPGLPLGLKGEVNAFLSDLTNIFNLATPPTSEWRTVAYGDWAEKWKEGLEPVEVGPRLVVKPTWCDYQVGPNQVVLNLDPGMAFGTGHHPTTFHCLKGVEIYFRDPKHVKASVLDVGTGSGILAMAAAALGRGRIVALDIDRDVLPVAAGNMALNGLAERIFLVCADPAALKRQFDLILANLHRDELMRLAPVLVGLGAPGARWILSGLLESQAEEVAACFISLGLEQILRSVEKEWVTLTMGTRRER